VVRRWTRGIVVVIAAVYLFWAASLAVLRAVNPPTTTVHMQRRVESVFTSGAYRKHYHFVPLSRISPHLQHAVVAAEDGRFYQHSGIDWKQVELVVAEAQESGEVPRGASTITQQLIKNLFFTTHRNPVRKVAEWTLAPLADAVLGKQRTLELYLNVVEWGPGVFGAEAAAQYHYRTPASRLSRDQAARLAAILPSPRRRRPARMDKYSAIIQTRMGQMGW
jgi:monofunctional biosynthetic peptidoglycan transglycosylase